MWQRVAPGRRFGPYELGEELGRGGSAVVYLAYDTALGRDVAIKVIAAGYAADETFRARFRQEAQLIARLRHPHILEVLDSGETGPDEQDVPGGLAYLVTEYLPVGSLAGQFSRQRSGHDRALLALAVAEQIGSALDWAHSAGVLHRDVKPSNVLIGAGGRLVLGDFGLARVLHDGVSLHLTVSGLVAGTPAYMAPEQALGEPADARTDLYGLAVVLYEIVAGQVPFQAETPLATMLAHVHQPVPSPHELQAGTAPSVEAVLLRALAKSRDERYQTGGELAGALRAAVAAAYGESQITTGAFPIVSPAPVATTGSTTSPLVWSHASGTGLGAQAFRPLQPLPDSPATNSRPPVEPKPPVRMAPRRPRLRRFAAVAAASLASVTLFATGGATLALGPGRPALSRLVARFAADVDAGLPRVERMLPPVNERQNPTLRPSFTILFNVKMEQESVERAVRMEPAVPLDFEWYPLYVVVTPRADLALATWYTLIVDETAVDIEGRPLAANSVIRYRSLADAPPSRGSGLAAQQALLHTPTPGRSEAAPTAVESEPLPSHTPTSQPPPVARPVRPVAPIRIVPRPRIPPSPTAQPPTPSLPPP
ncbi:MAG: protein kinase domain-containing protein, partial [Chloroflexota bacterium]